ncbi:MAG: beta-ketoacyl synthase N-terminal-like domain-containing protein [Pseudonocardiaceae bacterium]
MSTVPVISAWSAVSAFGAGREKFRDGVRGGRPAVTPLDPGEWPAPVTQACLVPVATARELLGRKGTRSMDRATALAVAAVGGLLHGSDGSRIAGLDAGTALVLGTSTGSLRSIMAFTRDALTQDKPYFVDPARFPNTVMNCAAGQSAIWHGLRGPNVTIAGGRASALLALNHALRLQRCGRARSVVCGAVEEFSGERAWLDWHTQVAGTPSPLTGEGCAVLLLEAPATAGRTALADVLSVQFALSADDGQDVRAVLAGCLRRALAGAGADPADVWAVAPSDPPGRQADSEHAAIRDVLGGHRWLRLSCMGLLGDTNSASAAFQIAALLSAAQDDPAAGGRAALVTAADRDGVVGCALLRLGCR